MKVDQEMGRCISILGTGSDVGKSIIATGLCRVFKNMGYNVAPYKAQNMSNNSFVTSSGDEIGRAQIVQAQAAKVEATADMNPVLIKPCSDTGAQVILRGKPIGNSLAADYFANTDYLYGKSLESLNVLRKEYEVIVMEGAGSCAEVNLRDRDFVNFKMAHASDAPVILVADIDRGGVFAQVIGTLNIIPQADRKRVKGIIINRFRGDATLFDDGIEYIQQQTKLPVLGLIPFFYHIEIDSEDGMPIETIIDPPGIPLDGKINIACIRVPHISNFTDFNPLIREDGVNFHYLAKPRSLKGYDLLILPGSKNVRSDLGWMKDLGWDKEILDYKEAGGQILGICGGYQMLGSKINDPDGIEGAPGKTDGLGFLEIETELLKEKMTTRSTGCWLDMDMTRVSGYEIHMGHTTAFGSGQSVLKLDSRNGKTIDTPDGWQSENKMIKGVYLHGLFDEPVFRNRFLCQLKPAMKYLFNDAQSEATAVFREEQYNLLADHFYKYIDMDRLIDICQLGVSAGDH